MRIVVLCGPLYPRMSPPTSCIYKYIDKLRERHEICIICQRTTRINEPLINGVRIYQVSSWINDLRVWTNDNISSNKLVGISKCIYYFTRLYGALISYVKVPTRNNWLIGQYCNCLKGLYQNYPFDAMISVSAPPCSHISAMSFKRKHPNIKWLTYFTDPFTFYDSLYKNVLFKNRRKRKNYYIEKCIYEEADYNFFTEELFTLAINEFNQKPDKNICFPYVLTSLHTIVKKQNHYNVPPKLLYAGALRMGVRNPEFALSVISKMKGIQFDIYQAGDTISIINKYKTDYICVFDLVDRERYLDLICNEYDILVNIGNATSLQAPSKLMELISTGKPVINFYVNKDSQYNAIEKYPLGINIGIDTESPVEKLSKFCEENKGKRMSFKEVNNYFPNNSFEYQLQTFEKLITKR